ncbi:MULTISPECIES: 2OG-Fe(II) oxygenase [Cobetia]|uniref:2OG-Fe(II) oxygenase n=1 Tax=Cobetia crustatorum TaxID=553385 RepID=A0A558HJ71_9GAMM|nr:MULTISPECIES: 2OG-Fe(II) oxygenase [Cobetia]TVU69182.1 2OG-Fe(II) oxygenase [Cobetia crustatorum]
MPAAPASLLDPIALNCLIDELVEHGYSVRPNFLPAHLTRQLNGELLALETQQRLTAAGIGRGHEHDLRPDIRGDAIRWLDRESRAQRAYLEAMNVLKDELNRALYMGLFEYEAHFAHYPVGSFYRKHLDSFRGRGNRLISSVLYLNEQWPADGGGEIVLYDPQDDSRALARVTPEAGTFVCFLSEQMPHEVLPTHQSRASVTGWFRRNASQGNLVDPSR